MSPAYSLTEIQSEVEKVAAKPLHKSSIEEIERIHIKAVLEANNWNREKSAQILGISLKTLYTKIKKYNLQ